MPLISPFRLRRALPLALALAAVPAWGRDGDEAPIDIGAARFVFVKTARVLFHGEWELRPSAPDTNLYTVRGDGSDLHPITHYANASVRRPAVSFDGRRILFSMSPRPKHGRWHVYECNADGSALRQLTDGACDDIEPFYLPDGRVGFLSTRAGILDEYHRELATLLHTMRANGSDVRRISFNLSHDIYPRVFRDGRIYAIRWDHRNFRTHRFPLFTIRPDGTEQFSYFGVRAGSGGFREFCELADGRLLLVWPDHRLKSDSPTLFFGAMGTVDVALGMDAARQAFGPRDGWLYRSPTTLPDGRVVAARARRDSGEGGIVVLGRDGRLARVVYDDPATVELFPAAEDYDYKSPTRVCVSRDGTRVFVSNATAGSISVVDAARRRVVRELAVGDEPAGLAVAADGRTLYAALRGEHAVVAVDAVEGRVTGRVAVGHEPYGLALSPDGTLLLVTNVVGNSVSVVAARPLRQLTQVGMSREPRSVAFTQDGRLAVVANALSPQPATDPHVEAVVSVMDVQRGAVTAEVATLDGNALRDIVVSPDGQWAYVAHQIPRANVPTTQIAQGWIQTNGLTVLDTATGRLLDTIRLGPQKPMSLVRRGHFLFNNARPSCFQGWLSCASCHPETGSDGLNWDLLNDGIGNRKNAKMLIGALETPPAMSTGVRADAETAVAKGFQFIQFRQHTPDEQEAVVAYLRWVRHRPSPLHREPDGSLDAAALRGKQLFDSPRVGCARCHPAPLFTTNRIHDVGTRAPEDRRDAFDTPSLRELYRTAPYLHSGAAATVRGVLTTFNAADRHGLTSHLTPEQLDDLIAYLLAL